VRKRHQKQQPVLAQLLMQPVPVLERVPVRQQVPEQVRELQQACHKRSGRQQRWQRSVREICSLDITWWEVGQFSKIVLQLPTKTKQMRVPRYLLSPPF